MTTPKHRAPGELVFACLMLLLSAFLLWTAVGISGFKSYTSAGSYPMAAAATMLVCALIVAVRAARGEDEPRGEAETVSGAFFRRIAPPVVLTTTAAIVVYMLTLEWLGFIVSSYLFLVVAMRLLGGKRLGLNLVVSGMTLAAIYVIFDTAFSVVLPTGTLWQGVFQ